MEFNRAMYIATRIVLRPLLGKRKRDLLMKAIWPDSYDFPKPIVDSMPSYVRRKWSQYRWKLTMGRRWEPEVMDYVSTIRGHVFVDVGANFGLYCTRLRKNFDRIIAIEADPVIFEQLRKVCPSNCEPINIAASNTEEYVSFYPVMEPMKNLGMGSMFPPSDQEWNRVEKPTNRFRLPSAPLSKILANEKEIDLIKVDVEGAEWLVLEGAEPIMPRIKRWVIELHEPSRRTELDTLMKQYGFSRCQWLDSTHGVFQRSACVVSRST